MAASGADPFTTKADKSHARLQRFWAAAREYWRPGRARLAWPLTISLGAVVLASLAVTYGLNLWNRHFFDALQAKDTAVALHQGLMFPLWVGAYLAICVFAMWARMTMQRTWRAFLNDHLLDRWLKRARFYQLELIDGDHKNPEHRINDDVRVATEMPVDFVTGFITSVLSAGAFFVVLWTVGGAITLPLGDGFTIPGYMLFAALAYAAIANGAMLLIGRRFVRTTQAKNQAEAEYRYTLARVRENAECIALLRGAEAERATANRGFGTLLARWTDLVGQQMRAVIVSQGHAQLVGVVPLLLCTPRFLDGSMSLGQMMQIASAFGIVQGAMSWLVDNYPRIAEWMASVRRVASLLAALDGLEKLEQVRPARILTQEPSTVALTLRGVSVHLGNGLPLVDAIDAKVRRGEKVLLVGDSGTGKSALVRALAGIWPWSRGQILREPRADVCVIPQRPYVPSGSLLRAVTYPLPPECIATDRILDALESVGLGRFLSRLDADLPWATTLSEGEKQRLAFARVLIHRPDILVLDEATSALHVRGQADLMRLIADRLPGLTLISIGHRPELLAFHERKLTMESAPAGARIVADEPIARAASKASAA